EAFAREMAHGLLCQTPGVSACGQCAQCHQFQQATHPDFFVLQRLEDKKEIAIDQVRELTDKVSRTAHQGGFKVVLVLESETLNKSAFNALLKTLEEPPEGTVLILTTHRLSVLPATIISRCRQMAFASPSREVALTWLQQALPQTDVPRLKKALTLNWGAPLAARNWVENKAFEWEAAWQDDLLSLQQAQLSVSQAVEKWKKWPQPEAALDYFYAWSVQQVRSALYGQKHPYNPNWLAFQKAVLQARQYWHQNVNKDLLLEGICLEWLQQHQPDYQPGLAFSGTLIRGRDL
ncbi:MAG: DNA-directed DNA polymerase, partial [Hydrogenovibrio sp.]